MQEAAYNPYYFYIARSLVKQSKQQKLSFLFTTSDKLKELAAMSARAIANLANFTAALAAAKLVPFTIIKALGLGNGNVNKKQALFLQIFLEEHLKVARAEDVHQQLLGVFMKPEYKALQVSLSMYIMKYFAKNLKHSKLERNVLNRVKTNSAIALKALNGTAM